MGKKKRTVVVKKQVYKEQVNWKDKLITCINRMIIMEKSRYFLFFVMSMLFLSTYIALSADDIVPIIDTNIVCFMLLGCLVIPLPIVVIHYIINKDIRNGLWIRVMELYEIKEEYNRFVGIKECIKNYKYTVNNKEIKDVLTNINVIEASIERDNTFSVLAPIFLTVFTVIFIDNNKFSFDILVLLPIIALIFLAIIELINQLPKNAFIKKVVASIREDIKVENEIDVSKEK